MYPNQIIHSYLDNFGFTSASVGVAHSDVPMVMFLISEDVFAWKEQVWFK